MFAWLLNLGFAASGVDSGAGLDGCRATFSIVRERRTMSIQSERRTVAVCR